VYSFGFLYAQYITFDVHIDAEEDTELWMISAPFFARLAESNIYVENFSYKMAADRFSDVMWAMQQSSL
jgi:CRP/FNR family transcriptional regulator